MLVLVLFNTVSCHPLDVPNRLGLKPVLSFHSEVVHVQHIPAGEGIGYGSTYITAEPMTIATIPVGYADGYPRSYPIGAPY